MKTEISENKNEIELPLVVTVIQPALRRLYNMPGASLNFKLLLKDLRDELEGKVYQALANVRTAQEAVKIATTEEDIETAQKTLDQQYKLADKATITLVAAKIPKSLIPNEDSVLVQRWNETSSDGKKSLNGDYVTEIVNVYKYIIDTEK